MITNYKICPLFIGLAGMTVFSCNQQNPNKEQEKPNVLVFLVDDLGWKDLGCYGSEFHETPNIDRFAGTSLVFKRAYSPAAVCSPSRASILTGKHPVQHGITEWTGPEKWHVSGELKTPDYARHLQLEEHTLAELLKENGYSTCFLGKWHIGKGEYYPRNQGFDMTIGVSEAGGPPSYFYPYQNDAYTGTVWPDDIPDLEQIDTSGDYLTTSLTNEALNYLDTVSSPFLLYFSHFAVHRPLEAPGKLVEKYRDKAAQLPVIDSADRYRVEGEAITNLRQDHPVFAAMVETVDHSFGQLMKKLEQKNVLENTIIIFTSDNGGLSTTKDDFIIHNNEVSTSVNPLRAGKGWLYEGGIRVPMIVGWKGKVHPGVVDSIPVSGTDLFPTIKSLVGLTTEGPVDDVSKDLSGLLLKGEFEGRPPLIFHYPHYHASGQSPASAIVSGKYKLIYWYQQDMHELFDLDEDIGERNNLLQSKPVVADSLKTIMTNFLNKNGAKYPVKN